MQAIELHHCHADLFLIGGHIKNSESSNIPCTASFDRSRRPIPHDAAARVEQVQRRHAGYRGCMTHRVDEGVFAREGRAAQLFERNKSAL